jgi:site-specific DNA recombinase
MADGNGWLAPSRRSTVRCAIYTRKSTEEGLEQEFNTLDAQRDAAEAFIRSQRGEGWVALPEHYDDGGFTGANMDRPALRKLLQDVRDGLVDCVMVYKVDRLTRSLLDFARIMEVLDKHGVSFVSVTQQFNTTSSLGRLTLNILLSFAQFEREMIAERTKDKMSAARRKGRWVGGIPMLGYDISERGGALVVNEDEAARVRAIFDLYLEHGSLIPVVQELNRRGWRMKEWTTRKGKVAGGRQVRNKYGALLKGILRCASCDAGMVHTYTQKTPHKLYRYYVCVNAHQRGYNQCPTRSVSAPAIEQAVIDQIRGIAANPGVVDEVVRTLGEQRIADVESLEREKRLMERELERLSQELAGLVRTGGKVAVDRMAEVQERAAVLEGKLREVRDQLAEWVGQTVNVADVRRTLREFDRLWAEMTPREQEKFVKTPVVRNQTEIDELLRLLIRVASCS